MLCAMTEDSYFLGNIISPVFAQKRLLVTEYILELPLAHFNKYNLLLSNFARVQIKNGNALLLPGGLFISLSIVSMKEIHHI